MNITAIKKNKLGQIILSGEYDGNKEEIDTIENVCKGQIFNHVDRVEIISDEEDPVEFFGKKNRVISLIEGTLSARLQVVDKVPHDFFSRISRKNFAKVAA